MNMGNKKNAILLHGSPIRDKSFDPEFIPDNERHWFAWIKNQLEINDFIVKNPVFPISWQPDYKKWKQEIEKNDINEETIIIGHSAGAGFAVRWLGDTIPRVLPLDFGQMAWTNGWKLGFSPKSSFASARKRFKGVLRPTEGVKKRVSELSSPTPKSHCSNCQVIHLYACCLQRKQC